MNANVRVMGEPCCNRSRGGGVLPINGLMGSEDVLLDGVAF